LEREFDRLTELHDPAFRAGTFLKTIFQVYAIFVRCDLGTDTPIDETPAFQAALRPQMQPLQGCFLLLIRKAAAAGSGSLIGSPQNPPRNQHFLETFVSSAA
jgi:hypothetical protein